MTRAAPEESIFRPAFVLMAGRALGFLVLFAVPVVLARAFDPGAFGTYKQLFLIYATLYSVAQLGIAESLFYFLPAAPRLGARYAVNAMLVLAAAGAACAAALWAGRAGIAAALNNPALAAALPAIGAFLTLMLVSAVLEIVLTARKRHRQAATAYALSDLLRALLLVAPVLWWGTLEALLGGAIAFAALRLLATLRVLQREYGGLRADGALARTQLAYAAPFSIYVLVDVAQANLHLYAVSARVDAATFAVYAVGCLSIPLVDFLMSSACNVMMVRMREHLLEGARGRVLAIWRDTTRKLVLLFAPLVGGLLVVAHEVIVVLFTPAYADSAPVFAIWLLTVLPVALLTDGVLRVFSQIRFLMVLGLVKLALLALVLGACLRLFGLPGGVVAVLVVALATKAIALARIRAQLRCGVAELLPWASLAGTLTLAAAAGAIALAVKSLLHLPALPLLLATGASYAMAYAALVWWIGPLTAAERTALAGWARRPLAAAGAGRSA